VLADGTSVTFDLRDPDDDRPALARSASPTPSSRGSDMPSVAWSLANKEIVPP